MIHLGSSGLPILKLIHGLEQNKNDSSDNNDSNNKEKNK